MTDDGMRRGLYSPSEGWRRRMAERHARLADTRHWGGYRQAHYAKSTDTLVVVVEAGPANLDPCGGDCKWYTICDDHDRLIGHSTLALARYHSSAPEEWCEVCSGNEEPDDA